MADERERALQNYRRKLQETRLLESKLKNTRQKEKDLQKEYEKSENDLKALQSVGQIVGEVLKQLTDEKFIVKVNIFVLKIFETLSSFRRKRPISFQESS
jgi:26S proteasome regulatory subunit T4